jgi:hypothetical protein
LLIELSECGTVKLFAIIYCDLFWYAKAAHNILPEKFLQGGGHDIVKRFGFDPL